MSDDTTETEVQINFVGADEATADKLRLMFSDPDEDVVFSHAFGGADIITIITKLATPVSALVRYLGKSGKEITAKGNDITVKGYSADEILSLCASPDFRQVFRPRSRK